MARAVVDTNTGVRDCAIVENWTEDPSCTVVAGAVEETGGDDAFVVKPPAIITNYSSKY